MPHLTVSFDEIATIVLDRPPQNRIDDQMVDELAAAVTAIERSDARPSLPGGSALPPVGTMVDVYRLAGKGDRGGTAGEYLEGVATGTVAKHEGRKIHIDVTIWPAQVKVGGVVMDYLKKGQPLRIQWSDQRN